MKKRIIAAGLTLTTVLTCGIAYAKNVQQTIDAYYKNIKLVVDGVLIEPKDVNGNIVEPFTYSGTTYLPVRAVGAAFGKDVEWYGDTATVDLHTPREKEKKDIPVYDRPYLDCEDPDNTRAYSKDGASYIWSEPSSNREDAGQVYYSNSITYELKGKAERFKGEFYLSSSINDATEGTLKIYGDGNKVIYSSPIMRNSTAAAKLDVDVTGQSMIKIEFSAKCPDKWASRDMYIKNPTIFTSDY